MKKYLFLSLLLFLLVSLNGCQRGCSGPDRPQAIHTEMFSPVANLSDDCDSIRLTLNQASVGVPGSAAIGLATGPGSPWWKAVRCEIISTGASCGSLRAGDGPSTASGEIVLSPIQLSTARLIFTKPKRLGAATDVYAVFGLERLADNRALFTWERDRCP